MDKLPQATFGLYIHWPYCLSKCPYCDFNSHVTRSVTEEGWVESICFELDSYFQACPDKILTTIFFGGGTPSLMNPSSVHKILEYLSTLWPQHSQMEITLEANPNSVERERFADFRQVGINRISVGIQSLNQEALTFLGRKHNVDEAKNAIQVASQIFENYSFDLIYARPGQTLEEWKKELKEALSLAGPHLSLYQLTIEPSTQFYHREKRGEFVMPEDHLAADFYNLTQEILEQSGRPAYEISNHAKANFACQHNLIYWAYGDYLGIGPGAHGRWTDNRGQKFALYNHRDPSKWHQSCRTKNQPLKDKITLSKEEQFIEMTLMGLRLKRGLDIENLNALTGYRFIERVDKRKYHQFLEAGFIREKGQFLEVNDQGRLCLNHVIKELLGSNF